MQPYNQSARRARQHRDCGAYMVELILALAATGVLTTAVVANMAELQRFSVAGQNNLLAAALGQELIDNARNARFDKLQGMVAGSPFTLLVNKNMSGQTGPAIVPRPMMLDLVGLEWSQPAANNRFEGTVTCWVAPDPIYVDLLRIKVEVAWSENTRLRKYQLETLISPHGIHN